MGIFCKFKGFNLKNMTKKTFAIYSKTHGKQSYDVFEKVFDTIAKQGNSIVLYKPLYDIIQNKISIKNISGFFDSCENLKNKADCMLSIGGDGTFLGTLPFIKDSNLPIIGVNNGRLGFLANTQIEDVESALNSFVVGDYFIDKRSILEIKPQNDTFKDTQLYALNDITIRRSENASMLSFQVEVNGEFLNNYWADGIIVSTPTGSTAYSLSCGGPILTPDSNSFILTPIASHTLTVRPVVFSDANTIKVKVSGRACHYTLGVDSSSLNLKSTIELIISKASFQLNIVQFRQNSFFKTIREKLMWGFDKRN